jgi:PqqD family protein of HPr-rel-A system
MELIWSIDQSSRFARHTWADETVVYDAITGDTHFLEPLATELLLSLVSAPQPENMLIQKLAQIFIFPDEDGAEEDVTTLVQSTLAKLQSTGLVMTTS